MKISDAVHRYLRFLSAEENKSPLTIANYRQSLRLMQEFCPVKDTADFSKETVRSYKMELHEVRTRFGKEFNVRTKNHHLIVLSSFLRYLITEEELQVYSPDNIKFLQEHERKIKYIDRDEMGRLVSQPDPTSLLGKRDRAILHLFFSTGMRLAELQSLNTRDVNFKTKEMSIRGKRGKIRTVYISEDAAESLDEYLSLRQDSLTPLFIRHFQKAFHTNPPGEHFRLSRIAIYMVVKKNALKAGLVTHPSPHSLRHAFATDLVRNGADLRSVQELLGHKDISTTQIYTHVTNPQLKEVHRRFHGKLRESKL